MRAAKALGPGRREVDSAASFVRAVNDGQFSLFVSLLMSEDDLCPADHCTVLLRSHMGTCLRKHFKSQLAWRAVSLRAVSGCHRFGAACLSLFARDGAVFGENGVFMKAYEAEEFSSVNLSVCSRRSPLSTTVHSRHFSEFRDLA